MVEPALRTASIVRDFGPDARVLHGIDMQVEHGEMVALMGPSGSGKSTLLNLVGLLDKPTSGEVWIDGVHTGLLDEAGLTAFRGNKLGFIFQFHCLLPDFTALENVLLPSWGQHGHPTAISETQGAAFLREIGLEDRMSYRATKLSGGQAQRVAVARALVHHPTLVLADEPTGNLDTKAAAEVLSLLRRLNRELGTAFLIVTHDPNVAAKCDRRIEIVDGRVKA